MDDLYALQMIDAMDAWSGFANREAQLCFLKHLTTMIVDRSGLGLAAWIGKCSRLTQAQLDAVLIRIAPPNITYGNWALTIEYVMQQIGEESGRTFWGWNTPQDHHHIDKIKKAFPRAKIIFLVRDPSLVVLSYKNLQKKDAAERYHTVAQSLAWNKAIKNYSNTKEKYPNSVILLSYEDIVENAINSIRSINRVLDAAIPTGLTLAVIGSNSSYARQDPHSRQKLTPLECWISDLILLNERSTFGDTRNRAPFLIAGMPELVSHTMRFTKFYSSTMLRNRDTRKRVLRLLRG